MSIRLVEPDLKDPLKARHVFECQECGLSRAYLMIAGEPSQLAARPSPRWQWDTRWRPTRCPTFNRGLGTDNGTRIVALYRLHVEGCVTHGAPATECASWRAERLCARCQNFWRRLCQHRKREAPFFNAYASAFVERGIVKNRRRRRVGVTECFAQWPFCTSKGTCAPPPPDKWPTPPSQR